MNKINQLLEIGGNVLISITPDELKEFGEIVASQVYSKIQTSQKKEEYLEPKEVCDILKISRSTLWTWGNRKYLCPIEVGGRRKYLKSDVDSILKR